MKNELLRGVCLVFAGLSSLAPEAPAQGGIEAGVWLNLIGEEPTLQSLEGRAVLLHFFGPPERRERQDPEDPLAQSYFPLIRRFHHENADKGLVILGFGETTHLASYDVPYPVGVGGSARRTFGVDGPNHLILLDRNGEVFWRGPANGLWDGKLAKAMRGAARPGPRGLLTLHLDPDGLGDGVARALEQCAEGELAKALGSLEDMLAKERTSPEDRADAEELVKSVEEHVANLMEQIEACFESGEALMAVEALEVIAKELKKRELGAAVAARLEEARASEIVAEEIEAAEQLEKLMDSYYARGLEKNRARFERLVESFPATLAARRVENLIAGR